MSQDREEDLEATEEGCGEDVSTNANVECAY